MEELALFNWLKILVELAFFITPIQFLQAKETNESPQKIVLTILESSSYNKNIRPELALQTNNGEKYTQINATEVGISMFVRKIDRIDDLRMEFTTQLTVRQIWKDRRIRYPVKNNYSFSEYVTLDDSVGDRLWTPDLFFSNEASGYIHKLMKPNSYKRVYPSGKVLWSSRATITFSCPMDFRYFPFDRQICTIRLGVFSEAKKDITIKFDDESKNPIGFSQSKTHSLPKFDLTNFKLGSCEMFQITGEFSCIYIDLYLKRQASFYISQIYLPSAMCVMLSWVTFWLGESISSRLSLTLTLLLTLATQISGSNHELPQVSYMKALDLWTGASTLFCVLAIFETATVAFILQGRIANRTKIFNIPIFDKGGHLTLNEPKENNPKGRVSLALDKTCRVLFPLSFFLFVVVYVLVYCVRDNNPLYDPESQILN